MQPSCLCWASLSSLARRTSSKSSKWGKPSKMDWNVASLAWLNANLDLISSAYGLNDALLTLLWRKSACLARLRWSGLQSSSCNSCPATDWKLHLHATIMLIWPVVAKMQFSSSSNFEPDRFLKFQVQDHLLLPKFDHDRAATSAPHSIYPIVVTLAGVWKQNQNLHFGLDDLWWAPIHGPYGLLFPLLCHAAGLYGPFCWVLVVYYKV